ncbi:hypothetical protein H9X96_04510 [Pedobacter sp. N36a]|uniref:hypothetical protein n=1 Tax=Pedobacter sp. N36a TaxID=2767996 RepID=UPI001656B559|nr:hypothetical protein [Pedobacter sp. N36a]MBC8985033.1 hypothetical protein [Pedobacter sp. N36a]
MKKHVSIFVTIVLLIFSTGLQELIKLPLLFQHYFEHKALNEDISFSVYLFDHYNSIPHTDNDEDRDNQLPFKSIDKNSILTSPATPPFHKYTIKAFSALLKLNPVIYHDDHIPYAYLDTIWQPPKV